MAGEFIIPALEAGHVRMKNKEEVYRKILKLKEDGRDKLQVITDFDRTVSKHHHNGAVTRSSYSVFELVSSLPKSFVEGAMDLYNRFRVIEDDPNMSVAEKLPHMEQWWRLNEKLVIGLPYDEKEVEDAVARSDVHLRTGSEKAFHKLHKYDIPVLVFSAGLGVVVSAILRHYDILTENVHVISNFFDIKDNKIIGFKGTLLHIYNKNQHAIEHSDYFADLSHRSNILLMGDSLGDSNMAEGVQSNGEILKIGLLSIHIDDYLPQYLEHFDIVLIDDQTMDVFNAILDHIL